ncbi:zinc/manganese transport system ATP-binding protein [Loktanella fryxellensis]|uniref:Zinc/manganese transport system ATP-binding protein n=1 Tax=Loktanella fryxellensis TaxID=245187 RepID=A0A1H8JET2_9RHOB|nr:zinc ABC transporter ATP-binding protein AztA [Loktanella fryxellensis]SEN78698.1 zinc/manganese transport system ATP-binding protein [Loktanella fryxellensis]
MPTIVLHDLTLGYDRHPAVHHLSATIAAGSLTAVVGPNGAGKSTLLKGIMGTLPPLTGHIVRDRTRIAYLPQQAEIDRSFPIAVHELVAMGLWAGIGPFGRVTATHRDLIAKALAAVGLTGFERRSIAALSGGQLQRVLFARVLLQDAQVILLDEPFTAIDARTAADLLAIVRRWHDEGRTVVAVLHDMDTVRAQFPETMIVARELIAHGPTRLALTAANLLRARQMCESFDDAAPVCDVPAKGAAA